MNPDRRRSLAAAFALLFAITVAAPSSSPAEDSPGKAETRKWVFTKDGPREIVETPERAARRAERKSKRKARRAAAKAKQGAPDAAEKTGDAAKPAAAGAAKEGAGKANGAEGAP